MYIVKPTELTQDLRDELICLCNKTWPPLSFHFWVQSFVNDEENGEEESDDIGYNNTHCEGIFYPALLMHWFEFLVKVIEENNLPEFEEFYLKLK